MDHIFFVHLSVERYPGCFQFLTIMSRAAMSLAEQMSLWLDEAAFGYLLKWDSWILR